ncbi:MAG: Zn-ribbon domain-containing OB-fold protein [Saccharolobus sp.]|uniref:Zn-ribbon domain-containing OB-fold protein n=1 Tax=Saccharolobus TaxID=2100760 RepID=UPI001F0D1871|nr:Zn-ribbon domain-containing OB-fold protein [Saccharolobus shibatae]MCH4816065.1 Zn-ribbon domain-containing OB-fold protein [Saccharolobus shibatae]
MQVDAIPLSIKYKINYPDEFIEAVKRGEIVATRCKNCGSVYFPPQKDCYNCGKNEMEWIKVSNEGEIMTYCIVSQKPQGFENYKDYIIGIVRTKDGINLMAWIKGQPKVGGKVRLTTDDTRIIGEVV